VHTVCQVRDPGAVYVPSWAGVDVARTGPDQTVAQALAGPACEVPTADEQQGESIAWLKSGTGYMTVSEGLGSDIHVVECEPLPGWATAKGAP